MESVNFMFCNIRGRDMKRRLLKNITLCILLVAFICLSCLSFSGCYRGPFFKRAHLQEHLVPDLPKPKALMWFYRGEIIEVKMTQAQFDEYVEAVYEYLLSCNFERFGTRGEDNSNLFGVRYYVNVDVSELSDFYVLEEFVDHIYDYYKYVFVWANETIELEGDYGEWIAHYLELYYDGDDSKMHMNLCRPIVPYDFKD